VFFVAGNSVLGTSRASVRLTYVRHAHFRAAGVLQRIMDLRKIYTTMLITPNHVTLLLLIIVNKTDEEIKAVQFKIEN